MAVFTWVLQRLSDAGLVGINATTLEANAALRSIVRRETGEAYETFLRQLAAGPGIVELACDKGYYSNQTLLFRAGGTQASPTAE